MTRRNLAPGGCAVASGSDCAGTRRPRKFVTESTYTPAIELTGRVAAITGGASGIGAASCRAFAAAGARVAVVDRNGEGSRAVAAEIGGIAIECDVSDETAINRMVAEVASRLGPIDILFSNAGIATGGDIATTPPRVWNEQWAVNVMAHVYGVRAVLPEMLARRDGYLVHTASMAGILTSHGNVAYATTKHAVVGLAEWLAITYHHRGIRVSLIAPLGVRTPMLEASDPTFAAMVAGPITEPEEIADSVLDAIRSERFLVTSDPIAQTWMQRKTDDLERWLRGMRRVQEQMEHPAAPDN
jgi:NAD(P)-dependent dehydrogenase (short-subunit alcohol dehydrogenase family)